MSSEHTLDDLVRAYAAADDTLVEAAKRLVVAALDGDAAVRRVLAGDTVETAGPVAAEASSGEMYLAGVRVRGFRGIGAEARLALTPGPGLTLITGRNGSAKSSFAEAVEMAFTNQNSRWDGKPASTRKLWQGGWRNLHEPSDAEIEVEAAISGAAATTRFRLAWGDGDPVDEPQWTVQVVGEKRQAYDGSQWQQAFEVYRPFLSYTELGRLVDGRPADLYDVLHRVLGLERLDEARGHLRDIRLRMDKRHNAVRDERKTLADEFAQVDDVRAARAHTLLDMTQPDLGALTDIALGQDNDASTAATLRALVALSVPDADVIAGAVDAVDLARLDVIDKGEPVADLDALLDAALAYHDRHGDGPCPVCATGTLDATRRATIESARQSTHALRAAQGGLRAAVAALRGLAVPPPAVLASLPEAEVAHQAWTTWFGAPIDDSRRVHAELATAVAELREWAAAELTRVDEMWRPLAMRLTSWIERAEVVTAEADRRKHVTRAESWHKTNAARTRDERMRPFAERTLATWQTLRKQSSVTLDSVVLAGSSNSRKAELGVCVDGEPTTALGVMSQGELHTLALALFLPRATVDDSPFRFIVIDDPVQAMDPSKVDGLAQVLAEVARDRQVIVFTHDDRLPESVRRQDIEATVWEVLRGTRSRVTLQQVTDPVAAYLSDAWAVAKETSMPEDIRREIAVTCCRSALEAAAQAKVRRVRLSRGDSHADVDRALARAVKTQAKVTLAVLDDDTKCGELFSRLNQVNRRYVDTVRTCREGAHHTFTGNLVDLIKDTRVLAEWLTR